MNFAQFVDRGGSLNLLKLLLSFLGGRFDGCSRGSDCLLYLHPGFLLIGEISKNDGWENKKFL